MILKYNVKNFYSIGKSGASVNFAVNGNAPKTDLYVDSGGVVGRVSIVETVIGPNASGKTRLLQGLAFIGYLIAHSYRAGPSELLSPRLFEPHRSSENEPSEVSSRFVASNRIFEYSFIFNNEMILKEELKEYSRTKKRVTAKTIAVREWSNETQKYTFVDKELGITNVVELRKNASMVASATQKDEPAELARLISDYWTNNVTAHNLGNNGNVEDFDFFGNMLARNSIQKLLEPKNSEIREAVKDILSKYDLGFDDFFSEEISLPDKSKFSMFGINHKFSDKKFTVMIDQESSGTKRLISILRHIMTALAVESGGMAVIDEIDAFLHPDIVEALVDLFVYPETNPRKAQLLFSTHNHRLLESFDKQQITLTEKNKNGETESWRLDEMEDVKSTDNYYTKYITGAYGARPKIEE